LSNAQRLFVRLYGGLQSVAEHVQSIGFLLERRQLVIDLLLPEPHVVQSLI